MTNTPKPANTGSMSFNEVLALLRKRKVISARLHPAAMPKEAVKSGKALEVVFHYGMFIIERAGNSSELTFNEEAASTIVLNGDRLTLEDAQGFMFDIDLAPLV